MKVSGIHKAKRRPEVRAVPSALQEARHRTFLTGAAITLIAGSVIVNEATIAHYFSASGTLVASTIWTVRALQLIFGCLGGVILIARARLAKIPSDRLWRALSILACVTYLFLNVRYAVLNPHHNFDMVGYIGSAIAYDESASERIHSETYAAVKAAGVDLTHGAYWDDIATNADHFNQLLPMYKVKTLYVALIYAFHKFGVPYVSSSVLVSVISAVALFVLMAVWLAKVTPTPWFGAITILLANAIGFTEVAHLSTPDALSSFLIMLSLFCLIEKRQPLTAYVILIVSLLARTDNLILAVVLIGYLHIAVTHLFTVQRRSAGLFVVAAVAVSFVVERLTGFYGWWTMFSHTFFGYLTAAAEFDKPFSFSAYSRAVVSALAHNASFERGTAFIGLFLVLTLIVDSRRADRITIYSHVSIALALAIIVRIVLFPNWEDRFFVAYYATSVICCVAVLTERTLHVESAVATAGALT
jgi:hypothetical protein